EVRSGAKPEAAARCEAGEAQSELDGADAIALGRETRLGEASAATLSGSREAVAVGSAAAALEATDQPGWRTSPWWSRRGDSSARSPLLGRPRHGGREAGAAPPRRSKVSAGAASPWWSRRGGSSAAAGRPDGLGGSRRAACEDGALQ